MIKPRFFKKGLAAFVVKVSSLQLLNLLYVAEHSTMRLLTLWRKVTSVECEKAHRRVLGNIEKVKELQGGNFYHEGR